jgi:two-component system, NarL family, response regulator LiaR
MADARPIRVMIVDDHEMLRGALAESLEAFQEFTLVGQAASGVEAIRLYREICPDVVLIDLVMPGLDGVSTIRELRGICRKPRIIAMSSFKDEQLVPAALEAGAISFLLKNVTFNDLANAIRTAYTVATSKGLQDDA